jgi:hypothetical protein
MIKLPTIPGPHPYYSDENRQVRLEQMIEKGFIIRSLNRGKTEGYYTLTHRGIIEWFGGRRAK